MHRKNRLLNKRGKCSLDFHSIKELEAEWQRQGTVKPDDERINNFRIVSNDNLEKFVVVTKKQYNNYYKK